MNSSKKKNNRKRPVCSQDDLSASDYKIDSTVNKKKAERFLARLFAVTPKIQRSSVCCVKNFLINLNIVDIVA